GKTTTLLCRDGRPELLMAVADTARLQFRAALAQFMHQAVIAQVQQLPVDAALHAASGQGGEVLHLQCLPILLALLLHRDGTRD
ncbi:hypothetical protein, partial [Rhizobium johnstonii]|uniref:hypothetical protein n=1 Tax=Rhizobium johnstonii TaxID=3019933 RepID=UPI003F9C537D